MTQKKFGTFLGVFIPNVTMMFGVILFLRLGVITANAGLTTILIIISISLVFMLITSVSISSITSSMDEIGSGGIYYLVSRTLGIEIGGALGIVIFLSQILSISLTTNGFTYLFYNLYPQFNVQMVEIIVISLLSIISIYSAKIALKLQVVILLVILAAILSILFGNADNLNTIATAAPFYKNMSFWYAFSLFYPALTGIEIGMALSGTLKTPARSIFVGNIISLLFVAATYTTLVLFAFYKIPFTTLISNPLAFTEYAFSKNIVILGIAAAALSSTLGSLVGAPRILQTMAEDGAMPKLLAKTYGKYNEPRYALIITAIISIAITIATNLEQIIPLLTMNCLLTYGLLNFICAINTLMNTASWRPTFKTHYLLSFTGVLVAIVLMFMINAGWSFISLTLLLLCYVMLHKKEINTAFSDIRDSLIFFFSRQALYKLSASKETANTWHPILLMLTIAPSQYIRLARLAHNITKQNGILLFGAVLPEDTAHPERIVSTRLTIQSFLDKKKIKGLAEVNVSPNSHDGFINFIKSYGIGSIQPNTVVFPIENKEDLNEQLFELLYTCYLNQKNMLLFQNGTKFKEKISSYEVLKKDHQIDIWWDSNARESFSLIVSLVALLHASSAWKKAEINLKCTVTSENAISEMKEYLEEFLTLSRLKMKVHVYSVNENDGLNDAIQQYSRKAVLTFVPLKLIDFNNEEEAEEYKKYLTELVDSNNNYRGAKILCCSLNNTDHQEIYSYPNKW